METIKSIILHIDEADHYMGYDIETTEQIIYLLIDNRQYCCESAGFLMSEDNFSDFIDTELLSIKVVDEKYKTYDISLDSWFLYNGGVVFVNIETSAGILQFVAYNCHNGFYGHEVKIISKQIEEYFCI